MRSQLRLIGLGLSLLGLAVGGALLLPAFFYPDLPFPRGPHGSEILALGAAGVLMLVIFRWGSRHEIRVGRMSLHEHPKPLDGWTQWAYHVDPFGKVIDD